MVSKLTNLLNDQNEGNISSLDIINFFVYSWKKLALAGVLGAIFGISSWFLFSNYTTTYVLRNNGYAVDLISWIALQNVKPNFALSKVDIKDLASSGKDFDIASTTIISFNIDAIGPTKVDAIDNAKSIADFMRTGGAYIELRNLVNSYEGDVISSQVELQKLITSTEVEMSFQMQRAKDLEVLYRRFPNNSNINEPINFSKDTGSKFSSISNQIVAVSNDINESKENLQRYRDRLEQIVIINAFIKKANPLVTQTFDGIALSKQLLDVEQNIRAELVKDDLKKQAALDKLRASLYAVQVRFTRGLDPNGAPKSGVKKGLVRATGGSFAFAIFLMLTALVGRRIWANIKKS